MPMKKMWDYEIEVKKEFLLRKEKVYSLLREERGEVCEFIRKKLRKGYIRPLKSSQIASVFFERKNNGNKCIVQKY